MILVTTYGKRYKLADYPDERYRRDPVFAMLVNTIYMMLKKAEFSPTEVREAAMLAQIKYEQDNPKPIVFSEPLLSEPLLREMGMMPDKSMQSSINDYFYRRKCNE